MKKAFSFRLQIALLLTVMAGAVQAGTPVIRSDVNYWQTNYATGNGPSGLYLGNLRGQKTWRDLVVANKNDNTISVRLCRDAAFNSTASTYAVDLTPVAVIAADMNRDNYDDVLSANFGTNTISLLPNLKNNTLGAATNHVVGTTPNPGPIAMAAGHANQSGRQDIFVANLNENTVTVLTNAGNCVLLLRSNITVGTGPTAIVVTDINNDTFSDVITANTNGTLTILQGDGTGDFVFNTNLTIIENGDPQPAALATGDFNGDGKIDLVTANSASNSITILTNSFGTNFVVAANYDAGTTPRSVVVRDLNRDNVLDIVVANENSGDLSVFLGSSDGSFTLANTVSVGNNPVGVSASNFNDDGVSDLAVVCYGDNAAGILLYNLPIVFNNATTAYEDTPKSLTVTAQQLNGYPLTYSVVTNPAHGSLTGSGPGYTYSPDTNYFGTDSFAFKVNDGTNDSAVATQTLTVLAINDAPTFTLSTNVVRADKFAVLTYSNFASSFQGASNETSQVVSYVTTSLSVSNLFITRPTIQPNGTLTFKPSTNNFGTSVVTIVAQDTGGKNYGGTNRSPSQTFSIETPASNPFNSVKGTYNGLYSQAGGVDEQSAGNFSFNVSSVGAFSGSVGLKAKRYNFSGQFDTSGSATTRVVMEGVTNTLTLQLDLVNNTDRVTGTLTNATSLNATVLGDRYTFDANSNPASQAGKYTMIIPGTTGSSDYPNGDSYATIAITTAGRVTISGYLADGTTANQSTYLSKNGEIPYFVPVYYGFGIVQGWIGLTNQPTTDITGNITWDTGTYYAFGWNTNVAISGSTYTPPTVGNRIINVTNVAIILRDGDLTAPITNYATLSANNTLSVTNNTNKLAFSISTTTGTVSGSFRHPVSLTGANLKGVVLQKQKKIEGYFKGPSQTGHFEIIEP